MDLPYHLIKSCGNVVFAAQGSDIHSFSSSLEHISTWKYPVKQSDESKAPESEAQESPAPEGPPTKRRKVQGGQDSAPKDQQGKKKHVKHEQSSNEKPFLQGLYTTTDGRHLVAITGSDKTIWVFEHDGAGNLKLLSQRQVPLPLKPIPIL
jgi:tRNA (guanine-N(7)-)-methyltransferase subunit TRM82